MTLLQSCTIVVVVVLTAPPLSLHLLPSLISNCLNLPIGTQARLWRLCCCLVAKSCPPVLWPPWTVATMLLCTWDFPGNNTGLGCHFLLQGIFPTQGSNLCLLCWQADSLPLSHQGSHMCVCVCVSESLCCIAESNTTLQINYTLIKKIKLVISSISCQIFRE